MIVIDPANTNHNLDFIARKTVPITVNFVLYNENTREETTQLPVVTAIDDKTRLRVSITCVEGDSYSFKVEDNSGNIYYRGKLFATGQDPQNYKTDNGAYTYSTI
jgi:hypothetical protein